MKKTLYYFGIALFLQTACSKNDSTAGSPPCTTCSSAPAPTLSLTTTPDTVWYAKTAVINWTSTNATSVSLTGGSISGISGSFTTPTLNTPPTYLFTATGPGGSITKQTSVYVWSQLLTFLCWDDILNQYGKWANTNTVYTTDGINWLPGPIDPNKYVYYPNGSRQAITLSGQIGNSHYQISYVGNDAYINLGETYNPPNLYKLENLSATTMLLSKYSTDGTTLFHITYTKVP